MTLITFSLKGFLSLLANRLFQIPAEKLAYITIFVFNIGLAWITLTGKVIYLSTPYWFPVALTLTILVTNFRMGFFTLMAFIGVNLYRFNNTVEKGLYLPDTWTFDKVFQSLLVDSAVSLLTFFLFIYFLVLSKRSIFERLHQAKENLYRSSKLSESGKVAANIATEVNNPMTIITGSSFVLRKELDKAEPDLVKIAKHIDKIEEASERIGVLIKNMKKMARDESQKDFCDCSLATIVDDIKDFFKDRLIDAGIDFSVGDFDRNIMINSKGNQIEHVLINILNNTVDAIENDKNKWIKIEFAPSSSGVEIMIADSGKDIPRELEDKVFDPLFTTKAEDKGSGLGLSIVQNVLIEHARNIRVDRRFKDSRITITSSYEVRQVAA